MMGKFGRVPRLRGCGGSKRGGKSMEGSLDLNMSRDARGHAFPPPKVRLDSLLYQVL